jgi:hypothetical protein
MDLAELRAETMALRQENVELRAALAERILTAATTLKGQDRDPFNFLVEAHLAHIAGRPALSLLPVLSDPT